MDRQLLITKHYKYKMIITTQRLKIIVAFIFVSSIGFSFFDVYYVLYLERHFSIYKILLLSMMVILPLMIVVAHTYILCYVYRRSNDISHCKVSGKNNNIYINFTGYNHSPNSFYASANYTGYF